MWEINYKYRKWSIVQCKANKTNDADNEWSVIQASLCTNFSSLYTM